MHQALARRFVAAVLCTTTLGFLAACGQSDAKEAAYRAHQSRDYAASVTHFDEALAARDASSPDWVELSVDRCKPLAHLDAARAEADFLALVAAAGEKLTDRDFSNVVSELVTAKQLMPAITIMDAGVKRFPDSTKMKAVLAKVTEKAQQDDDPAALDKLKGMGYLGG